jgi:deoxyribonuclease-4
VCLDTCHVFAAGYDLRTADAFQKTIAEFDRLIGLSNLKVIHVNDSKKALGSRVDRHEHIGEGEIGVTAFFHLVNDARLKDKWMTVETPDAETDHERNVANLWSLIESK